MPSRLPEGEPAPADGVLPAPSLSALGAAPFGVYVHVPFCAVRCGYCDFNTYTAAELGGGASQRDYAATVTAEIDLAAKVLGHRTPPVATVFFGGGTPTLLPPQDLCAVLAVVRDRLGLVADAEVTVEANPDSVTPQALSALREGGVTRVSFGMQSAVPHVLRTLDRTHDPQRVPLAVQWARDAGFSRVSLDLIYGTPGETAADWERSLRAALDCDPDHVSAYALVVEEGTRMAAQVRRGELAPPDDDDLADRYLAADELLSAAGFQWYEVSNWARDDTQRSRHNEGYWRDGDWWGFGPGAHSHVGGTRWWNVRHPRAYAERLTAGCSPAAAREVLSPEQRRVEQILLGIRLREGIPLTLLHGAGLAAAARAADDGLLDRAALAAGRALLTLRGRLLADAVVRDLVD